MCHLNAQSLISYFDEFSEFVRSNNYDAIAVSETWLTSNVVDA